MQQNNSPFFVPNMGFNTKIEEYKEGVILKYILSCDKDYPRKTFNSKNKAYVERAVKIPYTNNMSNVIYNEYLKLKNSTMLELNNYKLNKLTNKIIGLKAQQLNLF